MLSAAKHTCTRGHASAGVSLTISETLTCPGGNVTVLDCGEVRHSQFAQPCQGRSAQGDNTLSILPFQSSRLYSAGARAFPRRRILPLQTHTRVLSPVRRRR